MIVVNQEEDYRGKRGKKLTDLVVLVCAAVSDRLEVYGRDCIERPPDRRHLSVSFGRHLLRTLDWTGVTSSRAQGLWPNLLVLLAKTRETPIGLSSSPERKMVNTVTPFPEMEGNSSLCCFV